MIYAALIIIFLLFLSLLFLSKKNKSYSATIHNSKNQLECAHKRVQDSYLEIIESIVRIIDAKNSYTANHSSRVRDYSAIIAKNMKIDIEMLKKIEFAGLMHDIGKIGISENILKRAGKLSNEEKEVMQSHPIIGYNITVPMKFLSDIAPMILYHHERFDGKGYPENLAGEKIPLGARIIAVTDAYDAMISDRPYKKALTTKEAILELKNGSGTQFDSKIVDIFVDILEKQLEI
jgi:HD-GYP domain-containing protein (c-di-GMP phosphodiesterase class II)